MESTWGRRAASHCLEAGLASSKTTCSRTVPKITGRGFSTQPMATCQNHPPQETREGRLHNCKGVETDLTPGHARQSTGIGNSREDLAHGRDLWSPANQPLWSSQTTIR